MKASVKCDVRTFIEAHMDEFSEQYCTLWDESVVTDSDYVAEFKQWVYTRIFGDFECADLREAVDAVCEDMNDEFLDAVCDKYDTSEYGVIF